MPCLHSPKGSRHLPRDAEPLLQLRPLVWGLQIGILHEGIALMQEADSTSEPAAL